jgi:hypothetical protein
MLTNSLPGSRGRRASEAPVAEWRGGRLRGAGPAFVQDLLKLGPAPGVTPQYGDSRGPVGRGRWVGRAARTGVTAWLTPEPLSPTRQHPQPHPPHKPAHRSHWRAVAVIIPAGAPVRIRAPAPEVSATPGRREAGGWVVRRGPGCASAYSGPVWAIPSPSSRQPDKRAEWDGSSGNDLPPLETAREVCSADGPDDGDPGGNQAQGASSIPEPEAPPPEAPNTGLADDYFSNREGGVGREVQGRGGQAAAGQLGA